MDAQPTAIVVPSPIETENDRRWRLLTDFMRDTKEQLRDLKLAVDWLVEGEKLEREDKR
ncbi:MAG: hypothetical protein IPJ65_42760 [Archangiaceae bacterium]|nr:hypothetical protein [Archangiaceae bacterium]